MSKNMHSSISIAHGAACTINAEEITRLGIIYLTMHGNDEPNERR